MDEELSRLPPPPNPLKTDDELDEEAWGAAVASAAAVGPSAVASSSGAASGAPANTRTKASQAAAKVPTARRAHGSLAIPFSVSFVPDSRRKG